MPAAARLRNVQCLRAVAALLVIAVHEPDFEQHLFGASFLSWLRVPGGTGVDLFFVISGFIMVTTSWNAFGRAHASRAFLLRRIERIYPMYWIMTAAYVAFHAVRSHELWPNIGTAGDVVGSILLVPHGNAPLLTVGWTLQYEMAFYLAFSFALLFARRRLGPMLVAWLAIVLCANAIDARYPNVAIGFIGSPLHVEFLLGAVCGMLCTARRVVAPVPIFFAGLAGIAAMFAYTSPLPALPSEWFRALVIAPPMALVLYGAVGIELRLFRTGPSWLSNLGDASYSLYLSHTIVLSLVNVVAERVPLHGIVPHIAFVTVVYGACIVTALALYRFVEKPLLVTLHGHIASPVAASEALLLAGAARPASK